MVRLRGCLLLLAGVCLLVAHARSQQPPGLRNGAVPVQPPQQQPVPAAPQPLAVPEVADVAPPPGVFARLGSGQGPAWVAVYSVCFSPDGKKIVAGGSDKVVRLWDWSAHQLVRQFGEPRNLIHAVAFAPDGKTVAAGSIDDTITLWEADTGKPLQEIFSAIGKGSSPKSVAFSPDGKLLAAAGGVGNIRIRDAATGKDVRTLLGHAGMVNALVFSPDGQTLASCSHDHTVRLWDAATGKPLHQTAEFRNLAYGLAFSPDGTVLASGGEDGMIRFYNVARCQEVNRLSGHRGAVRALAFSPDGRTLASGSSDQTIRLWEVATGRQRRVYSALRGSVCSVAFAPNGKVLASGGQGDPTVLLWDVAGLRTDPGRRANRLLPAETEALWTDLGSEDAGQAYRAVWTLAAAPAQALPLLQARLKPPTPIDAQLLGRLVADLDSERYAVREQATQELAKFGERGVPALRKVLEGQPSLEVRRRIDALLDQFGGWVTSPERLRTLRGIEVLELADTAETKLALEKLVRQAPGTDLAHDAEATLKRLNRRTLATP